MTLKDISDKVGDKFDEVRTRVSDKMDAYAEELEDEREDRLEEIGERVNGAELYVKYWAPEIKKTAYILGVFLAASWGARYGVTRALANGRLKVKKH